MITQREGQKQQTIFLTCSSDICQLLCGLNILNRTQQRRVCRRLYLGKSRRFVQKVAGIGRFVLKDWRCCDSFQSKPPTGVQLSNSQFFCIILLSVRGPHRAVSSLKSNVKIMYFFSKIKQYLAQDLVCYSLAHATLFQQVQCKDDSLCNVYQSQRSNAFNMLSDGVTKC